MSQSCLFLDQEDVKITKLYFLQIFCFVNLIARETKAKTIFTKTTREIRNIYEINLSTDMKLGYK